MNKRVAYFSVFFFLFTVNFYSFASHLFYSNDQDLNKPFFKKSGLSAPELRCAAVIASGNVTLSWKIILDSANTFVSYELYSSSSQAGPYALVDHIIDINQFVYTDILTNANSQTKYYYIITKSNIGGTDYFSSPSDTLQTILLNVLNTGQGTAYLSWNPIRNPYLPTSSGIYNIYREYPAGNWSLIGTTQALDYTDTIPVCKSFMNYYVDIEDSLACASISNIDGDLIQDLTAPNIPVVDSVSVDSLTGNSVIGWTASTSGDVEGYIIYENKNGIWVPIDTVYGASSTYFVNTNSSWSDPDSTSLSYCIAAFDSCQNTSPINKNQNTIFLTSGMDVCNGVVTLNWTAYVNMLGGLKEYDIYVRENNGPVTLLGTNSASNLTYTHSPLVKNSVYIYSVRAVSNSGDITSTSNTDTIRAYSSTIPQFVYLRYATVVNNDYVGVKALVDTSGYISACKLFRSETAAGPFAQVSSSNPVPNTNYVYFSDHNVSVDQGSYYYKVVIADSCGNDVDTSNIGRTIYLQAVASSDMKNTLTWNEYEEWLGSVNGYNIYRKVDDVADPNPITTLLPGIGTYTDDVAPLTNSNGKFTYLVEAVEGTGNPHLCTDSSMSNEVTVFQPPRFYVPNAFVPQGLNNIFIPVNVYVNTGDYLFIVYNRWGMKVFETTDPNEGWDGNIQGEPGRQGVYVYSIQYKDAEGKVVEKYGTVTLLR
jgi:gliding motility-associated-like protein